MPRIDKKINKKKQEKDLIKLYKELDRVRTTVWRSEMVELDKPRFAGFRRFFVLRDDILKRKDAKDIQQILDRINCECYSKSKDFSFYDTQDRWGTVRQKLGTLSEKQWEQLPNNQKKFFWETWHGRLRCKQYIFQFPWMFVYKIRRRYVKKVPLLSPEMESRLAELHSKIFEQDYLWPRISKLMGFRMGSKWDDYDIRKEDFVERFLDEAIDEANYPDEIED